MKLVKDKEILMLMDSKGNTLRYSLKYYKFLDDVRGFGRINIENCEFNSDTYVYKDIIKILSKSGNILNGLKKLGKERWIEILAKSDIKINNIKYLIKRRYKGSSLLDFEATTPSKILKVSPSLINILRKIGEPLNWFEIEEFQILKDTNFETLEDIGIDMKKDNLTVYFLSDFCKIATDKTKTCYQVSILKIANILVSKLGYDKTKLKKYLDTYIDKNVDEKESLLYLLYSYADWNVFSNKAGYEKYPKDILNSVAKCSIDEKYSESLFAEKYKETYTYEYDTDYLYMPKSFPEFIEKASEMKNCLLNGNSYIWQILTKNKIILFGEREGKKICCELIKHFDTYIAGDILGVRNSKLEFENEIREYINGRANNAS